MFKDLSFSRRDIIAGTVVFFIALPLCLGIAQAAGAPLFSGVIAGIVGGIVVGFLSKAQFAVSGPAAGLILIAAGAIGQLGAFNIFLCAVIIAGVLQLLLGMAKAGGIADYFPSNVIEGVLAGIGLTIIIKELPNAVGFVRKDELAGMADAENGFLMRHVLDALNHVEPGAIVISVIGFAVLALWQTKPFKKFRLLPSAFLVVIIGVGLNAAFHVSGSALYLNEDHLVHLPVLATFGDFFHQFSLPNFSGFANPLVWQTGVMIAMVASIESLLSIEATDKLDPGKGYTSGNAELKAQGIGNIISGLIGGLPIASVIVRTSANINAGARTKMATIIHGALLLVCTAFIPVLLNYIPKACLASILIYTGYRLCRPLVVKHIWRDGGRSQFIPFAATVIAVVGLDLLRGVGVGLLISIFYILRQNVKIPYYFHRSSYSNGDLIKLTLAQEVSFLNKASIKTTLDNLLPNSKVIIDASKTEYIDFDVLEIIHEFAESHAETQNIKVSLVGFKNVYKLPKAATETDIISEMAGINELPKRSTGGYKKLLRHLTGSSSITEIND